MSSEKCTPVQGHKLNLTQVRVMLQVLLTTLFVIYFGQPSVERFLMKRVGGIAIHFD